MPTPISAPSFYLQIVTPDGEVARLPAGGALELHLVETLAAAVSGSPLQAATTELAIEAALDVPALAAQVVAALDNRNVGVLVSQAAVLAEVRAAVLAVLRSPSLAQTLAAAVTAAHVVESTASIQQKLSSAFYALKLHTRALVVGRGVV